MTSTQQRIAIAEACGWKDCDINSYQRPPLLLGDEPMRREGKIISYLVDQRIPDYLNDLNAMHEAEKMLTETPVGWSVKWFDYLTHLGRFRGTAMVAHATAAERSEAFLKTLNLWTE